MKYEEFLAKVKECISRKRGEEVRIYISEIIQNNGIHMDSICLLSAGENVSPAFGLESFYQMVCQGSSVEEVSDEIIRCYEYYRREEELDTGFFTEYNRSGDRIVCRLIHFQKNQELLSRIPHIQCMDLAIVYYYLMDQELLSGGTILIHNVHLKKWGVSTVELHDRALRNTMRLLPFEFTSMKEMICQLAGLHISADTDDDMCPMYVLTNKMKSYGAVYMIYGEVLEQIYEKLGEDYYVLPGSVHECILLPVSVDMDERQLQRMVHEINETQVEPEEILSDSVYRYYHSGKCLCIAAAGEDC